MRSVSLLLTLPLTCSLCASHPSAQVEKADFSRLVVVGELRGTSIGRLDPSVQAFDLAVPGHDVTDALNALPDPSFDDLTDLVLGLPGLLQGVARSQVEWAEALAPTTVIVWLGSNDVLSAAVEADATLVTPLPAFQSAYGEVLDRLSATGADLVVLNVPDVTVIPYLTPAEDVAAFASVPLEIVGPLLGLFPGDLVTPEALDLAPLVLTGALPGPLPPDVVLDAGEVVAIRAATASINATIAAEAAAQGAAHVDVHALLQSIDSQGVVVQGQLPTTDLLLTTDFLGGIFSLDGIHPTNTGHAILANELIRVIDRELHAGVRPVSLARIAAHDPLVLPGVGMRAAPAAMPQCVPAAMAGRVRRVLRGEAVR